MVSGALVLDIAGSDKRVTGMLACFLLFDALAVVVHPSRFVWPLPINSLWALHGARVQLTLVLGPADQRMFELDIASRGSIPGFALTFAFQLIYPSLLNLNIEASLRTTLEIEGLLAPIAIPQTCRVSLGFARRSSAQNTDLLDILKRGPLVKLCAQNAYGHLPLPSVFPVANVRPDIQMLVPLKNSAATLGSAKISVDWAISDPDILYPPVFDDCAVLNLADAPAFVHVVPVHLQIPQSHSTPVLCAKTRSLKRLASAPMLAGPLVLECLEIMADSQVVLDQLGEFDLLEISLIDKTSTYSRIRHKLFAGTCINAHVQIGVTVSPLSTLYVHGIKESRYLLATQILEPGMHRTDLGFISGFGILGVLRFRG